MSRCIVCNRADRVDIEEERRLGMGYAEIAKLHEGLNKENVRHHFRYEHHLLSGETLTTTSRAPKKKGPEMTWDSKGVGRVSFFDALTIPTDDEVRSLLLISGKDPDLYDWEIETISFNDSAWHRTPEVAEQAKAHTAWTGPAHVVKIRIIRKATPAGQPAQIIQATPVNITLRATNRLPKRKLTDLQCAVIYGDLQCHYYQDRDGNFHPTHDEAAVDVSLQITEAVEAAHGIDVAVDVGDLLDSPQVSSHPSALTVTQHEADNKAIQRAHEILAMRRAIAQAARCILVVGNHDQRWRDWLNQFAPQFVGLRRAGSDDEEPPVLSLESLLRLKEIGWETSGRAYPNDVFWLNPNTRVIHGTVAGAKPGVSLTKISADEVNTFQGHTPHGGTVYRTVARGGSPRTYVSSIVPGFMRTDGKVPAADSKSDDWGVPSDSDGKPWEQGFSIVFYDLEGHTVPHIEYVPIFGGRAIWRGELYEARCDVDGNPLN